MRGVWVWVLRHLGRALGSFGAPCPCAGVLAESVGGLDQDRPWAPHGEQLGRARGCGALGARAVPRGARLERECLPWHSRQCRGPRAPHSAAVSAGGLCSGAGSEAVNGACRLPLRAPLPNCSLSQLCGGGSGGSSGWHTGFGWHTGSGWHTDPSPRPSRVRSPGRRHPGKGGGRAGWEPVPPPLEDAKGCPQSRGGG